MWTLKTVINVIEHLQYLIEINLFFMLAIKSQDIFLNFHVLFDIINILRAIKIIFINKSVFFLNFTWRHKNRKQLLKDPYLIFGRNN